MTRELRLAAGSALLLLACSSPGNTGRSGSPTELVAQVPWTNGAVPLVDGNGFLVIPDDPVYPPIGLGTPDPGSRPIDCTPAADLEYATWLENFEADSEAPGNPPLGVGEWWSSNDDETKGAFRVPGDVSWYPGSVDRSDPVSPRKRYIKRFGLAAERTSSAPTCDGSANQWVLHFRGGRFNYYGAAAEHPLWAREFTARDDDESDDVVPPRAPSPPGCADDLCPPPPDPGARTDPVALPLNRADGTVIEEPHLYLDLTRYEGVTFWARRGPDGQPGMLVALQDKHTSDALNRERNTFCRRIKPCRPTCQNGLPCSFDSAENTHRCFDPALGMPPLIANCPQNESTAHCLEPALREELYPVCGASACRAPSYYPDREFDQTECKFHEFSGSQANYYCFKDVPPPPDDERCGDAWVAPVRLSTDWQIYVIPFDEFRQVGFAKRAPFLDLHSIYSIALQFPVGFADVYVDNVSFYRRRR